MALTAIILLFIAIHTHRPCCYAREIVGTNEWQLIGENDTVPAGLHIKMDLSTGERWARLVQDDEDDSNLQGVAAEMDSSGALSIVDDPVAIEEETEGTVDIKPQRDYEMMHRVMSNLPPEELERFGGLPALPTPKQRSDKEAVLSISPEDRAEFEAKMEELWALRQEELRAFQEENLADIPKVLQERIEVIKAYVSDPKVGREKVLEKRKQQTENDGNEDEEVEGVRADDLIECLKDLEYQLSDIDHARDFHTLGGWHYLVALLHEPVHLVCDGTSDTDRPLMYEIQSFAAMAMGTAVGNLGEFRSWALEDVSNAMGIMLKDPARDMLAEAYRKFSCDEKHDIKLDDRVSALFSLVDSFDTKLNPTQSELALLGKSTKNLFRTYKLRAVYALGSLLRGNAVAQQHFVSKNGPDALARYALGILSSANGEEGVTKLDYKLASKVLALGEDVVMGVLLQEEDYTNQSEENTISVSPNRMIAAFTTEPWCDLSLRMLSSPDAILGESQARSMKERAMSAIRALGPACKVNAQAQCGSSDSQECTDPGSSWGVTDVLRVKSEWNREGSGDGLDSVYRRELLDLIESVLDALQ